MCGKNAELCGLGAGIFKNYAILCDVLRILNSCMIIDYSEVGIEVRRVI